MSKNKTLLSENAVKVRLCVKSWAGEVVDRQTKLELAERKKANPSSVNASINLCGKAPKNFRRIYNKFRNHIYRPFTVAWDDASQDVNTGKQNSGWRLCPITKLDQLMEHFETHKKIYEIEKEWFFKNYDKLIEADKEQLGDLWKRELYPDPNRLEEKFRFSFELEQITEYESSNDIRLKCSKGLRNRIASDAQKRVEQNVHNAMQEIVVHLVDQVDEIVARFSEYDPDDKRKGFFTGKVFNGLKKTLESLPTFNETIFADDPKIKNAHQKLLTVISKTQVDESMRDGTSKGRDKREKLAKDLADSVDDLKGSFLDKAMK